MKKGLLAVALTMGLANVAQAGLTNLGFETGDLTGWTLTPENEAYQYASVESSWEVWDEALQDYKSYSDSQKTNFAVLTAGSQAAGKYTVLSKTFTVNAGETLTLTRKAAFIGYDELPHDDDAYVRLFNGTSTVDLWSSSIKVVGNNGMTDWQNWTTSLLTEGTYTLSFAVANQGDDQFGSDALFDVNPVPVPNAMLLLGSGLLGLAGIRRKLS